MWGDVSGAIDIIIGILAGMSVIISGLLYYFIRPRIRYEVQKEKDGIVALNRQNVDEIKRIISDDIERIEAEVSAMSEKTRALSESTEEIAKYNRSNIEDLQGDMRVVKKQVNYNTQRIDKHDRLIDHFQKMDGKLDTLVRWVESRGERHHHD